VKERVAARVWHVVCDKLLHIAVPLLAIIGWLIFGPPTGRWDRVGAELMLISTAQPS
jgi:drug/metabolite transporter (DMT)-like permease